MKQPSRNNIYLTGFMGCGKTTVGPLVAEYMKRRFIDTDTLVEQATGLSVAAMFEAHGEAAFRKAEHQIITQISQQSDFVVALGGGALTVAQTAETVLDSGYLVYLRTGVETLIERLNTAQRPLLKDYKGAALVARVQELLLVREPAYKLAPLFVDTDGRSPDDVALLVLVKVAECGG
jgi:shikimate kinase